MILFGILPASRSHVRLPVRSASPSSAWRFQTSGQFLQRGDDLQHFFLVVTVAAIPSG